jgi:hypothetical protein
VRRARTDFQSLDHSARETLLEQQLHQKLHNNRTPQKEEPPRRKAGGGVYPNQYQ